ncbi:Abi family protein [Bifidobacterium sp. ESL0690]|uniref:Abi family protein n=1 Tax=Bifidobacterium sp. ESL0690 TaxID=2983214 RepID=UPI0023F90496|nr:Abi family protein [Bifidobacterium sp. ESL0690]WEV46667.1 Abi family protein [Bifidobacterium sp. ESL0690]
MARQRQPNAPRELQPYTAHLAQTPHALAAMLLSNGLQGASTSQLADCIRRFGYYRLKGYWYPLLTPVENHKRRLPFRPGANFNDVMEHYVFDQKLRLLVFDGIITIETFLRSFLATQLALRDGPFGFMTHHGLPKLDDSHYKQCITILKDRYHRSQLTYIQHFRRTYSNELPPYWMIVGCLDYGSLQRFFYEGAPDGIKHKLASRLAIHRPNQHIGIPGNTKLLGDWLESIRKVRNKVAHHDRLWNDQTREVAIKLPQKQPKTPYEGRWWGPDWDFLRQKKGPAAFLTTENYLLKQIEGTTAWQDKFIRLMDDNPHIPIAQMGFPPDWRDQNLWK